MSTDTPDPELLNIAGPEGDTLFWHAVEYLVADKQAELQNALDETWKHYESITDERLMAIVGALCVEEAVQSVLQAFAPGVKTLEDDSAFSHSMKIKVTRSLKILPARILTACDLVRNIRNAFAHNLELKAFGDLDERRFLSKLEPAVRAFNTSERDGTDHAKLFRALISFILLALQVYSRQAATLREWLASPESREQFAAWVRKKNASSS